MKLCSLCKKAPARTDISGRQHSYCDFCNREYGKKNYRDNKTRYFDQARVRDTQIDYLINSFKNKPCCDCGNSYPPYVMDLDHKDPKEKILKVSTMRRRRMAFSKIEQEMAKCDVVCANCHRERTNKQSPARYSKP